MTPLTSCEENTTLTVKWWHTPPFWIQTDEGLNGVLHVLLTKLISTCCVNASVRYLPYREDTDSRYEYDGENQATFSVPVARDAVNIAHTDEDDDSYFIAAIQSPGFNFLVDDDRSSSAVLEVLMQTWPLVVIIVLAAAYAGLVIWILDTYWNPDHFPRTFLPGFSEGIWWAFVTMTTVGYGDKTPRSVPARLFSFIWILVGIVILSVFTATITTSLLSDASSFSLQGKTVGVIRGTESYTYSVTHGAIVKEFDSFKKLNEQLKVDESMDGIVMENFQMLHFISHLQKQNILTNNNLQHQMTFGILARDIEKKFAKCLLYEARRLKDRYIRKITKDLTNPENRNEGMKLASRIMAPQLGLMAGALAGFLALFLCALLIDRFYLKSKSKNSTVEAEMHQTQAIAMSVTQRDNPGLSKRC